MVVQKTGTIRSTDQFDPNDFRASNPRFTGENFQHNLRIADEVQAVATDAGVTPAQVALAWLLAKGDDIAPIPGTRRVARLEENVAADNVVLTGDQMKRLDETAGRTHTGVRRSPQRSTDADDRALTRWTPPARTLP